MHVPAKFQIVGQDEVVESLEIPFQLVGLLDLIEINSHILCFHVPEWDFTTFHHEVRRAAGNMAWIVGGKGARE